MNYASNLSLVMSPVLYSGFTPAIVRWSGNIPVQKHTLKCTVAVCR